MTAQLFDVFLSKNLSFFDLVEELIPDVSQQRPLQQICSLMRKAGNQWVLRENLVEQRSYFRTRYRAAYDELRHLDDFLESANYSVTQLSFFDGSVLIARKSDKSYMSKVVSRSLLLGTCLIIHAVGSKKGAKINGKVSSDFVFEALITEPSQRYGQGTGRRRLPLPNHHLIIYDRARVTVFGQIKEMFASYFCQQNQISSSCAHSATKVVHWHQQDDNECQLATTEINDALPSKSAVWRKPANGFSLDHYQKILGNYDLSMLTTKFEGNVNVNISPFELAYSFVESGFSSLIFFRVVEDNPMKRKSRVADYHVVPVLGHTMNTDEWLPTALRTYPDIPNRGLVVNHTNYLSSIEWVPHLIIHDDLMGPYMKISPNSLTPNTTYKDNYKGRVCFIAGIVPTGYGVNWSPLIAQENGSIAFREYFAEISANNAGHSPKSGKWIRRLAKRWHEPSLVGRDLIARTQLIQNPEDYIEHLRNGRDFFGNKPNVNSALNAALKLAIPADQPVWLVEFSIPELFCTNRSKIGEVILPFEAATQDITERCGANQIPAPLFFRFIECCRVIDPFRYADHLLDIRSHTPLFCSRQHPQTY